MTDIATLHNEVLDFLLEKRKENANLFFTLRTSDDVGVLSKSNYWFYGDKKGLYLSFWDGIFRKDGIPKLYLGLHISLLNNLLKLEINLDGTQNIYEFSKKLIERLDFGNEASNLIENEEIKTIEKSYLKNNWQLGLEYFLKTDKIVIDNFLKEKLIESKTEKFDGKIGFFSEFKFSKNLEKILKYKYDKESRLQPDSFYLQSDLLKPNLDLKLQSINLTNIGHFEDISLDLSKRVTVLIGENGSGKSTILRAIALGLTGVDFLDLDKDFQKEKNKILNGFLKINNYNNGLAEYAAVGNINLSINNNVPLNLEFKPSKLIADKVEAEDKSAGRQEIIYEKKYLRTLLLGFAQSERETIGKQFYAKGDMRPNVTDLFPLISNTAQDVIGDLVEWIYYYVHDREDTKPVDKLFEIFSKIIEEGGIQIKRPYKTDGVLGSPSGEKEIIVCTPNNPNGINLLLVSQGYKNIFRWVGGIIMKLYAFRESFSPKTKIEKLAGIILIDEIDTYLHPNWQYNILKVLVEEFTSLQFVVTTHSASVVTSLDPREVDYLIYDVSKQKAKNLLAYNPFGSRIDRAYVFGLGSHDRPLEAGRDFKELRQMVDSIKSQEQIKIAKDKVKAMKTIYDPYETDIIYAENMIRTKEMLISK